MPLVEHLLNFLPEKKTESMTMIVCMCMRMRMRMSMCMCMCMCMCMFVWMRVSVRARARMCVWGRVSCTPYYLLFGCSDDFLVSQIARGW